MLRVMLDTNVLVKFVFIYYKLDSDSKIPKNLKKYAEILDDLGASKFDNVMSYWNKFELRDVLMKLKLAEIYFLSGYTVDEFRDAKEEKIELKRIHKNAINDIIFGLSQFAEINTENMDFQRIEKMTEKGYSTMDIILVYQARLNNCDCFVTNDRNLYVNDELEEEFKIKIINVGEFLTKLRQS